jgi:hypothetical protein
MSMNLFTSWLDLITRIGARLSTGEREEHLPDDPFTR